MDYQKTFDEFKRSNVEFQRYYAKVSKKRRLKRFDDVCKKVYGVWNLLGDNSTIEDFITNPQIIEIVQFVTNFLKENTAKWNKKLRPSSKLEELIYVFELIKMYGKPFMSLHNLEAQNYFLQWTVEHEFKLKRVPERTFY